MSKFTPDSDSTQPIYNSAMRVWSRSLWQLVVRRERRSLLALATRCPVCGDHGYLWIHGDDDMPCPRCNSSKTEATF